MSIYDWLPYVCMRAEPDDRTWAVEKTASTRAEELDLPYEYSCLSQKKKRYIHKVQYYCCTLNASTKSCSELNKPAQSRWQVCRASGHVAYQMTPPKTASNPTFFAYVSFLAVCGHNIEPWMASHTPALHPSASDFMRWPRREFVKLE